MTPEEIRTAVEAAIGNKVVLSYSQLMIFVLFSAIAAFVGAYLKQKAEGLATKQDIEVLTRSAEDIKAQINLKSALEQRVLLDRYELIVSLEQAIIEAATQINKIRNDLGVVDDKFIVGEDIPTLTTVYEKIFAKRWLLGDSFSQILRDQADLLIEMVNDKSRAKEAEHAQRYEQLSERFSREMVAVFSTDSVIN